MALLDLLSKKGRQAIRAKRLEPAIYQAVKEVVKKQKNGNAHGFVINKSQWYDDLMKNFEIENDRMTVYSDGWSMIQESTFVDKCGKALILDGTGQPFHFVCESTQAQKIQQQLFDRTKYWYLRPQILKRGVLLGDNFIKTDIDQNIYGRQLGIIEHIRLLPEFTMYRMSDWNGNFPNPQKAFIQRNSSINFQSSNGMFNIDTGADFSLFELIHARYDYLNQINPKYGCSNLKSARLQYNIVQMMLKDMAIARKMGTFNRLWHKVDDSVGEDQFNKYKDDEGNREPDVTSQYITQGVEKIESVDAKNILMQKIDDLRMAVDTLAIGLEYPLQFFGFGMQQVSGDQLERMEMRLKRSISFIHLFEEWEIVRPLLEREFLLHGMMNVEYEIEYPPISFEDENKISKRELSKVQGGTKSRLGAMQKQENWSLDRSLQELDQIEEELKRFGPIAKYQPPGESLDKGKKGVENKNPEEQDISDTEGMSDEE